MTTYSTMLVYKKIDAILVLPDIRGQFPNSDGRTERYF